MGNLSRARRVTAALGFIGLLFAVLGIIMIVMVPSIIKQQVLKVGEGLGLGPMRGIPSEAGGRWAPGKARRAAGGLETRCRDPRALGPGP